MNTIDARSIKKIQKLAKMLRNEKIRFDEFAYNLIFDLVGRDADFVSTCMSELSLDEQKNFLNYARDFFASNCFKPHPAMVDRRDPVAVEQRKEEMKPQYEQLMNDLEKFAAS